MSYSYFSFFLWPDALLCQSGLRYDLGAFTEL
jgi:hypothetical protein